MSHSLIPERMLVVSPSLATTLGLEEAIVLQALNDGARSVQTQQPGDWLAMDKATLRKWLPFWSDLDIKRILKSLSDKGAVQFAHTANGSSANTTNQNTTNNGNSEREQLYFSFNATAAAQSPTQQAYKAAQLQHKAPIATNWRPDQDTVRYIHETLGIAKQFAQNQIQEFVLYHQSQGTLAASWATMFIRFVKKRHEYLASQQRSQALANSQPAAASTQTTTNTNTNTNPQGKANNAAPVVAMRPNPVSTDAIFNQDKQRRTAMNREWQPDSDTVEILTRAGVDQRFIQDCISEFILYWREKGDAHDTWNTKFVAWVRRQWAHYSASLANPTDPVPMKDGWQPAEDVYEILAMASIDRAFAQSLVQEFVLYWRDSKQLHTSWNSKFLQHAKHLWSKRLNGQTSQRDYVANTSVAEQLADTSWAQ